LFYRYQEGGRGTYTRVRGREAWTKQR
jgi:hypothetical protein